ncbi:MAG TPA: hypothetical protein VGR57_08435, partial [Ktedonobacterales bacterium]|nr:hypothetical protein [Ktedonobacterales bacterium]
MDATGPNEQEHGMAWWRAVGRLLAQPAMRGRALGIIAAVAWCFAAMLLLPQAPFGSAHAAAHPLLGSPSPSIDPTATETPTP